MTFVFSVARKYAHPVINRAMSTSSKSFECIGVAGLGLMGHGICQLAASVQDSTVIAYESDNRFLEKGKSRIEGSVAKMVKRGKMSKEDADKTLGSIVYTTNISDLSNVDLLVEAVIEDIDLKKELYNNLGRVCNPDAVFASNTSSLSVTEMAEVSGRPKSFVGLHFFNPVQMMKLVEVVRTHHTDPEIFDRALRWARDIGKETVECGDTPGFIVNRLLVPSLLQAMLMIDRADASIRDIDLSLQLGAGHPMGPLHLADYIGLDTCYFIVKGWTKNFPDEPAFIIPKCLEEKVNAGELGRKSGRGFYTWDGDKRGNPIE